MTMAKMMTKSKPRVSAASYLEQPYARMVVRESDGTFRGEILEFPGCIAIGDSAAEALANLERVADGWLEAALANEQPIPEPMENIEYSGKLVLRLPKSLHKKAALAAERDGVSLNQFIVSSLAEQVGQRAVAANVTPGAYQMIYDMFASPQQTLQWSPVHKSEPLYVTASGSSGLIAQTYPFVQNRMMVLGDV
jgi:predicted RNase H-like HicB family nuclease